MAVPKRRTSHSKKKQRRAHDALTAPNAVSCQECGEPTLMHHACPHCGMYRGRKIIEVHND